MTRTTETILASMIEVGRSTEIIPMFFQPVMGRCNKVSAAVRMGLKTGAIYQDGTDGMGKPKYRTAVPASTHIGGTA